MVLSSSFRIKKHVKLIFIANDVVTTCLFTFGKPSYKGHCTDVVSAEELTHSRIVLTAFSYNINFYQGIERAHTFNKCLDDSWEPFVNRQTYNF